ncbi:MAG: redoxin domain-containing protein [Bacteroidales bacterium]|nr:redoxin domain-containing protein [Bacteroidales bacterium]
MKKNILTLFLLLNVANLFSQNVTIKGSSNKPEALVRLLTYKEMLTCEQTSIFETKSNEEGEFVIEADIEEITLAQVAINLERVDILLKPNANYEIEIVIPEQEDDASYFERQQPTLKMIDAKDDNLYYQYYMSDMIIDDFVLNNFNQLYRGRKLSLLDTLDVVIEKELGKINNDYVKNNIRYRKAAIQMMVNNDNAKKVINQYFNKQEILYSQAAYMNLFQEIFTNYLTSRQFNPSDIRDMLYADYGRFVNFLQEKDVFLSDNKNLAEIIIAWNLKRMYYEMPDEKNLILNYLNIMLQNANNENNKEVINDIIKQMHRLSFNAEAPNFSLKDVDGNIVKLSDFKEDLLLVQFLDKTTSMTDYQFEMLNGFSQQWQDTIQIISISAKEYFNSYKKVFDDRGYRWLLLNLDNDILLLEKYQVKTFPDYIILGTNGRVGMSPAPSPDQYLDYHVRRLYNYYKKNDKK